MHKRHIQECSQNIIRNSQTSENNPDAHQQWDRKLTGIFRQQNIVCRNINKQTIATCNNIDKSYKHCVE